MIQFYNLKLIIMKTIIETGISLNNSIKEQTQAITDFVNAWKKIANILNKTITKSLNTNQKLLSVIKTQNQVIKDYSKIKSKQIIYQ